MNSSNKKLPGARNLPKQSGRQAGHAQQPGRGVAQPKNAVTAQSVKQPVAPPVYRPQAKANAVLRKTAVPSKMKAPPAAPPVYSPQPQPKVLQAKTAQNQRAASQFKVAAGRPAAPAVYRPEPARRVLQAKMLSDQKQPAARPRPAPLAPPIYRPELSPRVLQAKKAVRGEPAPPLPNRPALRAAQRKVIQAKWEYNHKAKVVRWAAPPALPDEPVPTGYRVMDASDAALNLKFTTRPPVAFTQEEIEAQESMGKRQGGGGGGGFGMLPTGDVMASVVRKHDGTYAQMPNTNAAQRPVVAFRLSPETGQPTGAYVPGNGTFTLIPASFTYNQLTVFHSNAASNAPTDAVSYGPSAPGRTPQFPALTQTMVHAPVGPGEINKWSGVRKTYSPSQGAVMKEQTSGTISAKEAAERAGVTLSGGYDWMHLIAFSMGGLDNTHPNVPNNLVAGTSAANSIHRVIEASAKKLIIKVKVRMELLAQVSGEISSVFHVYRTLHYAIFHPTGCAEPWVATLDLLKHLQPHHGDESQVLGNMEDWYAQGVANHQQSLLSYGAFSSGRAASSDSMGVEGMDTESDYAAHHYDDGDVVTINGARFVIGEADDDGDCMYESALQLTGAGMSVAQLREEVARRLGTNPHISAAHIMGVRGHAYASVDIDLPVMAEILGCTFSVHAFAANAGLVQSQRKGNSGNHHHMILQYAHVRPLYRI